VRSPRWRAPELGRVVIGPEVHEEPAFAQEIDWNKVDEAFGRKGAVNADVMRPVTPSMTSA